MRKHRFLWLAVGVVAAVCALGLAVHLHDGNPHSQARSPIPQGPSRLVLYQAQNKGPMYVEGSQSYLTVVGAGGWDSVSYQVMSPERPVFSKPVSPGRYTITSWQRPCDGNCSNLDPATDRCHTTVSVRSEQVLFLSIVLTPGRGCRILPRAHG